MDPTSDFQKNIVEYLESVHICEFMAGTMDEIKEQVQENMKAKNIEIPLRLYLMHLQNLHTVAALNVNPAKVQLTGGKISKILQMI